VARLVAIPLQAELGQSIIVDNKPGAGARSAGKRPLRTDGYTLMLSNSAPISIAGDAGPPARPAEPHAAYISSVANVFVIHPSVPAKNMGDSSRGSRRRRIR
jgi:tripartite-type tricarboxylate transporter receptor subunit TctC